MARHLADDFKDWASFRRAPDAALPVYRAYVFAVDRAVSVVPPDEGELRDQLSVIIVPDQMLRNALSWGEGDAALNAHVRRVLWPNIFDGKTIATLLG
jgi:hypothetical protein